MKVIGRIIGVIIVLALFFWFGVNVAALIENDPGVVETVELK